ncbi:antibiotic biosynthesis monooxygenase [Bacillus sp. ISL-34]|uniref:antibiotic biosynthesis monooxygenase family protein n=1 Tax=Bacillus sp. ISL-34 TaxID=2819121 RepID=UPI002570606C|nr:antibiotic biosynthesis monooxygenase [Bacillus sp. ISL-34]
MPTINKNEYFTVIVEFEVEPQHQQALIEGIISKVEPHFKRYSGFVSASFHASEDGMRVVNYAQWHSKEAWSEFIIETDHMGIQAAVDELV